MLLRGSEDPTGIFYPRVVPKDGKFYVYYLNSDRVNTLEKANKNIDKETYDLFYDVYSKEGKLLEYHKKYFPKSTPKFVISNLHRDNITINDSNYYSYYVSARYLYLSRYIFFNQYRFIDEKAATIYKKRIVVGSMQFSHILKNRKGYEYPIRYLDDAEKIQILKTKEEALLGFLVDKDKAFLSVVNIADKTLYVWILKNWKVEKKIKVGKVKMDRLFTYKVFPFFKFKNGYAFIWMEHQKELYYAQTLPIFLNITFIHKGNKIETGPLKAGVISNAVVSVAAIDDHFMVAYSEQFSFVTRRENKITVIPFSLDDVRWPKHPPAIEKASPAKAKRDTSQ